MTFDVEAGTTPNYTCSLLDESDAAIVAAQLTTLTLTVINLKTGVAIRDRVNALNANNVTVSADGSVAWAIQATDLAATETTFLHCVFEWTWNSGVKKGWHDFALRVTPVPRPTA